MRGILVTLISVTALVSAATVNPRCHKDPSEAAAICRAAGSEGVLVAHEKCDKFYKCSHGRPVALLCPDNLLYNPEFEYCDWPNNVDCGDRVIPKPDDSHNNGSAEVENVFDDSGHEDPSQARNICARPGSDGALIAHEQCTKFYKCFQSHPVELKCPSELHYNYNKKQCDWPQNVECGSRVIPHEVEAQPEHNDTEDDEKHEDVHEEEGHSDPSQAPVICGEKDSDSVLVAHELCNHYYICLHGRPFPINCPPGLHFNPKNNKCDWPENVECRDRLISEDKNDVAGAVEDKKVVYNDPSKAPEICAEHESVLVAHEKCNRFYQCAGGKPVERKCAKGLVYNYNTEKCDWLWNVECGNRVIAVEQEEVKEPENVTEKEVAGHDDPSKAPTICAEEESDGVLVAHERCNKFYICASGAPVARPCPKGLLYNPKIEKCDWADDVTCNNRLPPADENEDCDQDKDVEHDQEEHQGNYDPSKAPEICAKEKSDGVLVAHEYCNKFYICVNSRPFARNCPISLLFNPSKNECDWAHNVVCRGRVHPNEQNSSDDSVQTRRRRESAFDYPNNARIVCGNEESNDVLVAHEYCNAFYQCVDHAPVKRSCPRGLHFSAEDQHCEWPQNVDCGDRIIPEDKQDDAGQGDAGQDEGNEEKEPVGNNYDDPSKAPEICNRKDSDGTHIAHEYCNKFYKCVNNSPLPLKCPADLYYNPKTERCDWQANVQCNERIRP